MTPEKNLTPSNSSIVINDLNDFLRVNNLRVNNTYCRVFENDRVLITVCYGSDDIGTVYYNSPDSKWKFDYFFDTIWKCEKLNLLIDAWIRYVLNKS